MHRVFCIVLLVGLSVCGLAQDQDRKIFPDGVHPFIEPQFGVTGGYNPGAVEAAGLEWQQKYFLFLASANYGFVRKNDDNDQVPNEHGHTRGAGGMTLFRKGNNYFGGGAMWAETAVTPYRKYGWSPEVDFGHDFLPRHRIIVGYFKSRREYTDYPTMTTFTPGPGQPEHSTYCICTNGVTGGKIDLWYDPGDNRHFLMHTQLMVYGFHTSLTDPYNLSLTATQKSQISAAGSYSAGLVIRY